MRHHRLHVATAISVVGALCWIAVATTTSTTGAAPTLVDDIVLTDTPDSEPHAPVLVQHPGTGGYLLAFEDQDDSGASLIRGQLVAPTGQLTGPAFDISTGTAIEPVAAYDSTTESFAVAYACDSDGDFAFALCGTTVTGDGAVGPETEIESGPARFPDLVAHASGVTVTAELDAGDIWWGDYTTWPTTGTTAVFDDTTPDARSFAHPKVALPGSDGAIAALTETAWNPVVLLPLTSGAVDWAAIATIDAGQLNSPIDTAQADGTGLIAYTSDTKIGYITVENQAGTLVHTTGVIDDTIDAEWFHPAVAYEPDSQTFVVAWHGTQPGVTALAEHEIFSVTLDSVYQPAAIERISNMGIDGANSYLTQMAAPTFDSHGRPAYVWTSDNGSVPADVNVYGQFTVNEAELGVTASASPQYPANGELVEITIGVVNNGPDAAANPQLRLELPSQFTFMGVEDAVPHEIDGDAVIVSPGALPNGASATVTVNGTVTDGAALGSTATMTLAIHQPNDLDGDSSNDAASAEFTVARDTSVTVTAREAFATNPSAVFDVAFGDSVTGFDSTDIVLGGTANHPGVTVGVSGGAGAYVVTLTDLTTDGVITVTVPAGSASNEWSRPNTASTGDNSTTIDRTAPTVTIDQASGQTDPTNGDTATFDIEFSEDVTGFDETDINLSGTLDTTGTTITVTPVAGSDTDYTATITNITGDGTLTATINAAAAQDTAGNDSTASTSTDNTITIDRTAPTPVVAVDAAQPDPATTSPALFTITFDEPVTGIAADGVSASGTSGADTIAVSGGPEVYLVEVTGMSEPGTIFVDLLAGAASDQAGNVSTTGASASLDFAPLGPVLDLPDDIEVENDPGLNGATVNFEATYSAPATTAMAPQATCTPQSGSFFPIGTTTVQCSATRLGTTSSGSFIITVIDTEPPELDPAAISVDDSGDQPVLVVTGGSDNTGTTTITCDPVIGSQLPVGDTTVTCTIVDGAGNSTTIEREISVASASPSTTIAPATTSTPTTTQAPATTTSLPAPGPVDDLPATGGDTSWTLRLAGLLVAAGAIVLLAVGRRRRHEPAS